MFAELEEGAADDNSTGNANSKNGPNGESGANGKSGKGKGGVGKKITEISGGEISFPNTEQQQEAARLQRIEEKLINGEKISESEVQDIRSKISGFRFLHVQGKQGSDGWIGA